MHAWIQRQAGSAFALALLLSFALFGITAATDEGGVALATRAARIVPLLAVPAAAAYAVTLVRAARRGETRALEAVGVEPLSWQIWVALAALLPALGGALLLAFGLDASGLFPVASTAKPCALEAASAAGHAIFVCAQAGLRVQGASIQLLPSVAASGAAPPHGLAAAAAVVLTAVPVVLWSGAAVQRPAYGLWAVALLLAETMACQAVGARVAPVAVAILLPALAVAVLVGTRARQKAMARVSSTRARTSA